MNYPNGGRNTEKAMSGFNQNKKPLQASSAHLLYDFDRNTNEATL